MKLFRSLLNELFCQKRSIIIFAKGILKFVVELERMKETLVSPQTIRRSMYDEKVWLFYRFFKKTPVSAKYLMLKGL